MINRSLKHIKNFLEDVKRRKASHPGDLGLFKTQNQYWAMTENSKYFSNHKEVLTFVDISELLLGGVDFKLIAWSNSEYLPSLGGQDPF